MNKWDHIVPIVIGTFCSTSTQLRTKSSFGTKRSFSLKERRTSVVHAIEKSPLVHPGRRQVSQGRSQKVRLWSVDSHSKGLWNFISRKEGLLTH